MSPGEAENAGVELDRAVRALRDASLLLEADSRESAASRLYYAAFHATRAALIVRSLHAKTHAGQVRRFEQTYGPTPLLDRLLGLRIRADYGQGVTENSEQLRALVTDVEAFVDRCGDVVAAALAAGADEPDPAPDL